MKRIFAYACLASLCLSTTLLAQEPDAETPGTLLQLEDCRISAGEAYPSLKARCGTLRRPLNPEDPAAGEIDLRVAVVAALNLQPEPDPVVPLAGGPGQGAVQFYAGYAAAFEPLRRNRDILLVDQRGTGQSARMDCPIDDDVVGGQLSDEETLQLTRECLDQLPHDPRFFTTSIAVQDLDAVRAALGYETLNLYGVSYGSRVAQHYARRFPGSTRTVVLDGVVPPQLALGPDIAVESQKALERIFARCAESAACNERFPDIDTTFTDLRNRLADKAVRLRVPNPQTGAYELMSFGDQELAAAIRLLAYHPNSIAMIPLLVSEAANGNTRPLAAQYQMTLASLSDSLALGMHNAVMCSEDAPYYDADSIDRNQLESSYMGAMQLDALTTICSAWPQGPADADIKQPLASDIPTLLLSGTADPITPPAYAQLAAVGLKTAWLIDNPDQGHGQLSVGCMPRVIDRFVSQRTLSPEDYACTERNFVMPFFLDFAGPSP